MYFWRIHKLKQELVASPLSDRQLLPYLLLYSALTAAAFMVPIESAGPWDIVGGSWSVVLAVFGTVYVYRRNGGSEGEHLLQRILTIGWVVGVRWGAALACLFMAYFSAAEILGEVSENTTWYEAALLGLAEGLLYWRIGQHVSDVATGGVRPDTSPERA